jgi:hypothetical protein
MGKRIRGFFESIVFAGMKPGGSAVQTQRMRWLGPLRTPVERLLSGGPAPSDPLYLTNRTIGQKLKPVIVLGVPCLIVGSLMVLVLTNQVAKKTPLAKPDPTPAETAAKMLPNMAEIKVETNRDLEIIEVHVDRSQGIALVGTVMNNTTHAIPTAEIVFDLTDSNGSQLGGVSQKIENLAPQIRQSFRLPLELPEARFALVREVRTR